MHQLNPRSQSGFALLFIIVILMGLGGIVLTGYTQGILKQVEESKFKHNQRVLKEAKQALLQFAYNYPVTNGNGPGRLPCADIDNDGDANTLFGDCITLGRLPWNEPNLNLYDIRDADGQRLWYAVSDNFATNVPGGNIINSDTVGSITVRDQSGNVIYDGSSNGVAAVIIAPGKITARNGVEQDRSVGNGNDPFDTNPDTDPGIISAANYLDLVGTEDNANFTQGSATDGFILGPVNIQSTDAVNDQMIVITAAEVIEVAEKAVLQAYRKSINDYLAVTGNVYPWLYNYVGVPDVAGLTSYYPADSNFATELATNLDNFGRIPSIFGDYFTESDSQPIESKLSVALSLTYPITPTTVGHSSGTFLFNDGSQTLNFQTADKLTNVGFVDIADIVGDDGRLTGTVITPESFTDVIYFWDDDDSPTGVWTMCLAGADELSDCNRDGAGNPKPGGSNDEKSEILRVVLKLDFNIGVVNFDTDYTTEPVIAPPVAATGATHASITGTFAAADVIFSSLPPLSASYEYNQHYHAGDVVLAEHDPSMFGTLNVADLIPGPLALGMRYYPELPDWAFDNGWHDSIMMAYANNYRPDILGACIEGTDCIQINNLAGNNDNKISILTLAGQHNWDDDADSNFINDLPTIFDAENADILDVDGTEYLFDRNALNGNDLVMIVTEL
ncbi:MAG: type II secretion system protein [Proteobacteria bacterium]|nr:type II secretion system protein [Pseudomonadota bacterium]